MTEPSATPQHVLTHTEDGIYHIRLNRPEKKNALTHAMYSALVAALEEAGADEDVRVVLLAGTPGCFSSGNDVLDFMMSPVLGRRQAPSCGSCAGFPRPKKPIVAAVSGLAIGIGTTMLLHCDLVYAASGTRFQMPFVNLGICPEAASSYLLPRIMGYARAAELLLLGQPFDAETAHNVGIVNAVCTPEDVEAVALEKARLLAATTPRRRPRGTRTAPPRHRSRDTRDHRGRMRNARRAHPLARSRRGFPGLRAAAEARFLAIQVSQTLRPLQFRGFRGNRPVLPSFRRRDPYNRTPTTPGGAGFHAAR